MLDVLRKKPTPTPDHVLQRSYQNAMRAIGRYADAESLCGVALFEVQHGFILRAFSRSSPTQVRAIEVPDEDIQDLILKNYGARTSENEPHRSSHLLPGGYEDFFRAIGHYFDGHNARSLSITEMVDAVAISFFELHSTADAYSWRPQSFVMQRDAIARLLDEASARRQSKS